MLTPPTRPGRTHLLVLLLLLCEAAVASSPLLGGRWFIGHDAPAHLDRLFAVSYEIRQGDFYPRWLSQAHFGQGLPVLNFYSPAFYLVVGWAHAGLGLPLETVLKLTCLLLFFLGGWGMFVWLEKHYGASGALLAASVYIFLPYHFLDLYVRAAFPEFSALALFPFLFHAIDRSFSPPHQDRGVSFVAVVTAAIILTHNLSAFLIAPFAIVYFGWKVLSQKAGAGMILRAALGPLAGLALSAFYWLPLAAEIGYLGQFREATAQAFHYSKHFVYPRQWISRDWGFGASWAGPHDGMSFQLGAMLLVGIFLAMPRLRTSERQLRRFGFLLLALGVSGVSLTHSLTSFIYTALPPLHFIQFPWRFLGPATLFLAAFAGLAAGYRFLEKPATKVALLGSYIILAIVVSGEQRTVGERILLDLDAEEENALRTKGLREMGAKDEFLPFWALSSGKRPGVSKPALLPTPDRWHLEEGGMASGTRTFHLTSSSPADLVLPAFYFPGWRAAVDGISTPVTIADGGFVACRVPAGTHRVTLWFGSTPSRIAGWGISTLALACLGGFCCRRQFPRLSSMPAR